MLDNLAASDIEPVTELNFKFCGNAGIILNVLVPVPPLAVNGIIGPVGIVAVNVELVIFDDKKTGILGIYLIRYLPKMPKQSSVYFLVLFDGYF